MTPQEMAEAIDRARFEIGRVADTLRREHPIAFGACRLSVRMVYSALLIIDRAAARIE